MNHTKTRIPRDMVQSIYYKHGIKDEEMEKFSALMEVLILCSLYNSATDDEARRAFSVIAELFELEASIPEVAVGEMNVVRGRMN